MSHSTPPQFQIKNEGLAARCEVCHQADKFDSETGYCWRCSTLSGEKTVTDVISRYKNIEQQLSKLPFITLVVAGVLFSGGVLAIFYFQNQWSVIGALALTVLTLALHHGKKEKIDRCPDCGGVFPIGDADREGVYCRYCGVRLRV